MKTVPNLHNPLERPLPDTIPEQPVTVSDDEAVEDQDPTTLDHKDLPALRRAKAELVVRHKKKNLDLFL